MALLLVALGVDLAAIAVLAYGMYFRRYGRADLLLAYVSLNVGVFAVTSLLTSMEGTNLGLGLGLFGILSIIRLRSDAITQEEVAYYFVALALGVLNGLRLPDWWIGPLLSVALVGVLSTVHALRVPRRTLRQTVTLGDAYTDLVHLRATLEQLLGGEIRHVLVLELDLVRDITVADVRYRLPGPSAAVPRLVRRLGEVVR